MCHTKQTFLLKLEPKTTTNLQNKHKQHDQKIL